MFVNAMRESTLSPVVREAAMANLSTLRATTSFRTADGEFHGFEGVDDKLGCCFGNCTHVWNYETSTAHIFPTFARSLRKAAFGYSQDEQGAMHFRQLLPDGKERSGFAAADGQMGQIVHAYLDWSLTGDRAWLTEIWPRVKKGIEFAWVPGGWDANRDGVMEGVQHNTYDVEFYGPNPLCGVITAALRAGEEMARVMEDAAFADECHRLFARGAPGWTPICSTANITNSRFVRFITTRSRSRCAAIWVRTIPSIRNIRSGRAVWWISCWDSRWRRYADGSAVEAGAYSQDACIDLQI